MTTCTVHDASVSRLVLVMSDGHVSHGFRKSLDPSGCWLGQAAGFTHKFDGALL